MTLRVATAAVVVLLGCAGWGRDLNAQTMGELEPLAITCDSVSAAGLAVVDVPVTVEAPRGFQPVGELFGSPDPSGLALLVDADAFGRTVHADVERVLGCDANGDALYEGPRLVVRIVDVRTISRDAGGASLKGRIVSRVVLVAELRGQDDEVLWSKVLGGKGEMRVYYFRLEHYEATLSEAYCAALAKMNAAVPDLASTLASLAGGSAMPARAAGDRAGGSTPGPE